MEMQESLNTLPVLQQKVAKCSLIFVTRTIKVSGIALVTIPVHG